VPHEPGLDVDVRVARGRGGFSLDAKIDAPPGVTILFGPSGSGKSTLLAVIAGLVRPDTGHVRLEGTTWFSSSPRLDVAIHERRVAFVFQSLALFPHLTAQANVEYGIERSVPPLERAARARASLVRFHAEHLAARRPATFSGGEGQRVALARAFAMNPRLVLLDEPFSAMDRSLRGELVELVRTLAEGLRVPVIHVTHRRGEALALGDRVILMRDGRVEATGDPRELLIERGGVGR